MGNYWTWVRTLNKPGNLHRVMKFRSVVLEVRHAGRGTETSLQNKHINTPTIYSDVQVNVRRDKFL